MSYLLDAVGREKQQQGRLDPALAAPLAPKRALPWHLGWPLVGAAVGAGLSWLALSLQPQPEPAAPAVAELAVIKQVTMPIPVAWEPAAEPETQYVYTPDTADIAPEEAATAPERERHPEPPSSSGARSSTAAGADAPSAARTESVDTKPAQQPANAKLLAAFERAVADLELEPQVVERAAIEPQPQPEPEPELSAESLLNPKAPPVAEAVEVPKLGSLPVTFQKRLPDINITAHVYSSDADNRWLRANGRELQEGDAVASGVTVREIRPNEVILEMSGQAFSVPALGQL